MGFSLSTYIFGFTLGYVTGRLGEQYRQQYREQQFIENHRNTQMD